jgi:hypothetical protein
MTDDTRTPEEIERRIEAERRDLSENLESLQDKFSVDTLIAQVRAQFSEHGGDVGRTVAEQAKANPIPLALTAIGIGWLMLGSGRVAPKETPRRSYGDDDAYRPSRRPLATPTHDDGPDWARDDVDDDWAAPPRTGLQGAGTTPASTTPATRFGGTSVSGDGVPNDSDDDGSSMADRARDGMQSTRDAADRVTRRLSQGTEDFSEEARARVVAARRRAVEIRRQSARGAQQGADAAADFYERQPLVVGAIALALGSAMAGALPRTRLEDDAMGDQSDALMAEAERLFEVEKAKLGRVAQAVADESRDVVEETKGELDDRAPGSKTAAQAATDEAAEKVDRVVDAAKSSARDEKLGKPKG